MILHGYELISEWKISAHGRVAVATKDGKKYFLKRYQTPVAPIDNGTLNAETFNILQQKFDDFVSTRKKVIDRIREIPTPSGNIIIPCDEFIDENHYVEVSRFIENAVEKEDVIYLLRTMDEFSKKLFMKTAAGALVSIHSKHIIHGDLSLDNVLMVRNFSGSFVANIIGFDSSYSLDDKPKEVGASIDYCSPELGKYLDAYFDDLDDEAENLWSSINEKTDIFSLGLIFHLYLTGEFPRAVSLTEQLQKRKDKGKVIYPWVALNSGAKLQISYAITDKKHASLIEAMLDINPEKRPTAAEVLKML